jgi:hypothetical protein
MKFVNRAWGSPSLCARACSDGFNAPAEMIMDQTGCMQPPSAQDTTAAVPAAGELHPLILLVVEVSALIC